MSADWLAGQVGSVDDVRKVIERIKEAGPHDDAKAHSIEDDLHQEVLKAIAERRVTAVGCIELATEALKTLEIEFGRWVE